MEVSFHGAIREVTGSCILLRVKDKDGRERRLLIDCGMYQGERMCGDKNLQAFGFDPKTLDAVFVTHPHADHTGRLPKLLKEGFTGQIYLTPPCQALCRIVLDDTLQVMTENAKRCHDPVLFSAEDVEMMYARTAAVNYHEAVEIAPGITVMFHDAGHILGSAFISVDAEGKRVVFSGDIGNDNVPILPKTEPISHADVVICESTYGNRVHEPADERRKKLRDAMASTILKGGVLMIPAFSIERTQELLYEMHEILRNDLKTDVPIFLDSPMAIRATAVYRHFSDYLSFPEEMKTEHDRDFFSFPNLHETLTVPESKAIFTTKPPYIVIAGSGMMSGGRILHHLKKFLPDPNSCVLIIGYQGYGTLGRQIFDGNLKVNIHNEEVLVKAHIAAIGAFSAHGDKIKLTKWLHPEEGGNPKKIFLVHGDADVKEEFAGHLRRDLGSEVAIPEAGKGYQI